MTTKETVVASKKRPKKPSKPDLGKPLEIRYSLAELPSSQHRAGLAGLVLFIRWIEKLPPSKRRGVLLLTEIDEVGCTLRLDHDGLATLFDQVYAATYEDVRSQTTWKGAKPIREEKRETTDAKGKTKSVTYYVYPMLVPVAPMLEGIEAPDPTGKRPWLKLWRDMVWQTLRGVPATRAPFDARANGKPSKDVDDVFVSLAKPEETSVELPSTYFLGAQAVNAENVPFRDRARFQFLLHFWPYAASIYVPAIMEEDGKIKSNGYAVAVPDVAKLEWFCDVWPDVLRGRSSAVAGFRPKEALLDVAAESGLDATRRVFEQIRRREGEIETADVVFGFDVFHVRKDGNSVRVLKMDRLEPEHLMIDEYAQLRSLRLRDQGFRRLRVINVLDGNPWWCGFDRLICTTSDKDTIASFKFCSDARASLPHLAADSEGRMTDEDDRKNEAEVDLERVLYQMMQSYVLGRMGAKYGAAWEKVRGNKEREGDYNDKKRKIAKDAFLAVRSRSGADFVDYFAGTLCSVSQGLSKTTYGAVAQALRNEPDRVRTLTLLALSAVS